MSSSVAEILSAARAQEIALVGEVCGYLVLGAADAVLSTLSYPGPELVRIHDDGNVEVSGERTSEAQAERTLREVLGLLLREVRTPFPNLSRVAGRPDVRGIASLITELEAALVPVNRRAARRSLSRLSREARRAVERGLLVSPIPLSSQGRVEMPPPAPETAMAFEPSRSPRSESEPEGPDAGEFELAPETERIEPDVDPFDEEPTIIVAPVEPSLTELVAELAMSAQPLVRHEDLEGGEPFERHEESEPFDFSIDVDFDSDEASPDAEASDRRNPGPVPVPESSGVERTVWELVARHPSPPPSAPPSRPGSDRYRSVRPRSDSPPRNPTPLIPPSEGSRARPSDLEALLSAMKPKGQPDQLQRALDGLSRESTPPGSR